LTFVYTTAYLGAFIAGAFFLGNYLQGNRIDEHLNNPKVQSYNRNLGEREQLESQFGSTSDGLERLAELKEEILEQERGKSVGEYLGEVEIAEKPHPLKLLGGVGGGVVTGVSILVIYRNKRKLKMESERLSAKGKI